MSVVTVNEADERAKAFLDTAVKDYKIFIDTCSLLCDHAESFWTNIVPILANQNKTIIIPLRVCEEIQKFAKDPDLCLKKSPSNPALHNQAKNALRAIVRLQKAKHIEIYGDETDNFADNVFQTVFTQYRLKFNLMLITQDNNLAQDITAIGKSQSVKTSNQIRVEKINKYGYLSQNDGLPMQNNVRSTYQEKSDTQHLYRQAIPDTEKFSFSKEPVKIAGSINVSYIPKEGDTTIAEREGKKHNIKLISEVASGGEGIIYTTNLRGVVAKIYKKGKIDKARFEKIKLMISKTIDCEGVCFPLACLYNSSNEFVGYLMRKAEGKVLQKCLFIRTLLKKAFPEWKKRDTVELCITILEKIKYLHERNIILGDINPNNILVASTKEVYFVDTDSYQVEGFPCPVGTANFTAPEIQRKKYDTFLRTIGNEKFAVATLLFMIMLPGKPPYSLQGGESIIDNIINMDFPYPLGVETNGRTPDGSWRFCWSHMPYRLKSAFYNTFKKDGANSKENTRLSTSDWIILFNNYLSLLDSGAFLQQDEMANDLFPTRFKKNPKATYIKCKMCGQDTDEDRASYGFCEQCLHEGEVYRCAECGKEMIYTNYQKLIKHSRQHEKCRECNEKNNSVYTTSYCSNCGNSFEITYGEKKFFDNKGYQLPKKCPDCRSNNTSTYSSSQASTPPSSTSATSSNYTNDNQPSRIINPNWKKESNNGSCFITTAVCDYLNKPDDCYELTTLRKFRDNWLSRQSSGSTLVKEYYDIAPKIVEAINTKADKNKIYDNLWKDYISPCIKLIEFAAYEPCRDLYIEMVTKLKTKYIKE
jgi:serine/threonine protein kinase/rRNA-processing protein FCF1